jgi:hypothetical protein
MFVATAIVTVLLAALLTKSAVTKLSYEEHVVRMYTRVGVPRERLRHLAVTLLVGAAGLLVGLAWAPVGVAAAVGLLCYFSLAVAAHVMADDLANLAPPLVLATIAAVTLALRLATA